MVLVTGGAASRKSEYAERLVSGEIRLNKEERTDPLLYVAAMQPFGAEAEERIRKHRVQRAHRGFQTVERYTDLAGLSVPEGSRVLLEDLGNLTANEMFSPEGAGHKTASGVPFPDPAAAAEAVVRGVLHLKEQCSLLVVVTNEIFSSGSGWPEETQQYLRALGEVNRRLAEDAELVTEVVCGVPSVLKPAGRESGTMFLPEPGQNPGKGMPEEGKREMIFITGPLCSGKHRMAERLLEHLELKEGRNGSVLAEEVQSMAKSLDGQEALEALAEKLAGYHVVTASETGCGVIPADRKERETREMAGRLNCLLAERAAVVIRMCCGIPLVLKGTLDLPEEPAEG